MAWGKCKKQDEPLVYNSLEELLELLAEERRKSLKKRRTIQVILGLYVAFIATLLIVGLVTHSHGMGGFGGMFNGITGMVAGMYAATQTQKKGVQALAEFDDIRAVPRLIEMLEYHDTALKTDVSTLLTKLLPRLQASDASMLSPEHHAILNRILGNRTALSRSAHRTGTRRIFKSKKSDNTARERLDQSVGLLTAILTALQQVGTESSLSIVEELAEGKGNAKQFAPIQQAAQDCLPFLRARAENQRQIQTLLRASDGNQTATDVLLRPAMSTTSTTPAEQLLRAAPYADAQTDTLEENSHYESLPAMQTLLTEQPAEPQIAQVRSS